MSPEPDPQDETKRVPASYPTQIPLGVGGVLDARYRLDELLGRGATAAVFRATDELLGREVAVKAFHAHLDDPTTRARQLSEMKLLASLNHPNLVTIYDARLDDHRQGDGPSYLVMELVEGHTLRETIGNGMPDAEVARVGSALAAALGFVHARGLVHRDVKPANILIARSGTVKLSDFGIARLLGADRMTSADNVVGTPAYFSPEQAVGRQIEAPTDIYALGLVLLECLTGEQAFSGSAVETAIARLSRDPDIPAGLSPAWASLLREMTAREPGARPSAEDVSARLDALRTGRPMAPVIPDATAVMPTVAAPAMQMASVPPSPHPSRTSVQITESRGSGRRRGPVLVAAGGVVLAAAIAAGIAASSGDDPEVPAGGSSTSQSAVVPASATAEESAPAATSAAQSTSASSSAPESTSPPSPPSPASEAPPSADPTKEKKGKKSDQPPAPTPR